MQPERFFFWGGCFRFEIYEVKSARLRFGTSLCENEFEFGTATTPTNPPHHCCNPSHNAGVNPCPGLQHSMLEKTVIRCAKHFQLNNLELVRICAIAKLG